MNWPSALIGCTVLGLQHGIDVDHVAAISDVTSVQPTPGESIRSGLFYASGHAVTVGSLGIGLILLQTSVPAAISAWMERAIGLTLVALGGYILSAIFRGQQRGTTRRQAMLALFQMFRRRSVEQSATLSYGPRSSLSLGILHGVGAETPTQLSALLIAANLGGLAGGIAALSFFAVGMFASNMVLTTAATAAFVASRIKPAVFRWLGAFAAAYSLWIGIRMMIA
jgi:high-affinity nickel permease